MSEKINTEKFILRAKEIHKNKYDYSLVEYKGYGKKIKIICEKHGEFEQLPEKHISRKQGCPNCSIRKKLTNNDFINKAMNVHNNKYDYSLCEYINAKSKIKILCKEHGMFEQIASSHINQKTGCPICSNKHRYTNEEFINLAKKLHNNKYCYSSINYINNYTKINIICYKHGIFRQTPSNHLSGKGCELCNTSKNENLISLFLESKSIKFFRQHRFNDCKLKRKLPFDFYLPEHNICIEFQGRQHYEKIDFFGGTEGFKKQIERDKIKENYCLNNNIKLLKFKYNDNVYNNLVLLFS